MDLGDDNPLNIGGDESSGRIDYNPLSSQSEVSVNSISLSQLRNEVSEIASNLEETESKIDDFSKELGEIEGHLDEMNETLESRELNIHLIPPDTNVSRLAIQAQLVFGVFVVTLAVGRFIIPDAPFTYIGIAFGASIATNLITNKAFPAK